MCHPFPTAVKYKQVKTAISTCINKKKRNGNIAFGLGKSIKLIRLNLSPFIHVLCTSYYNLNSLSVCLPFPLPFTDQFQPNLARRSEMTPESLNNGCNYSMICACVCQMWNLDGRELVVIIWICLINVILSVHMYLQLSHATQKEAFRSLSLSHRIESFSTLHTQRAWVKKSGICLPVDLK